jgi:DnaJ-class molecular chaperone
MIEGKSRKNQEKFKEITDAYDILGNKDKKAVYDGLRQT